MRPKKKSKKGNKGDIMYTPHYGIEPIFNLTPKHWKIWEPSCGSGNIVNYYKDRGSQIIGTEIEKGYDYFCKKFTPPKNLKELKWTNIFAGLDFFTTEPPAGTDCIITNPPYSMKTEFLARCIELNKPFALLMPYTASESMERNELWNSVDLEMIFTNKRIEFMSDTKSNIHFPTAWFCVGFGLRSITGKSNNFVKINKPNTRRPKSAGAKLNFHE